MKNRLVSMTAFVLEQEKKSYTETEKYRIIEWQTKCEVFDKFINYANFLNQPLTLGMFVCEVPEPEIQGGYSPDGDFIGGYCEEWIKSYQQAKDKVLFDGFEYAETHSIGMGKGLDLFVFPYTETKIGLTKKAEGFRTWFKLEKIEDLVQCNLTITTNAIKQLKL